MSYQLKLTGRQFTTVLALGAIAAIHLLDLPGKFAETPYLGFAYVGMIAAAIFLIERILTKNSALDYLATAGLAAAVMVGFIVNRTIGMPGATGDIGNWFEPLGFLSLFVEGWAILQAVQGWRLLRNRNQKNEMDADQLHRELFGEAALSEAVA
jgi:thiol:disulfide interchange protein